MSDSDTLLEIIRHPQLPLASLCLLTSVDPGSEGLFLPEFKRSFDFGKASPPSSKLQGGNSGAGKSREFALGIESKPYHRDL